MYQLRDFLHSVVGLASKDIRSDEIFCTESDLAQTLLTNQMQETLACYSYILITEGWLTLTINGRKTALEPGNLYIYSPGIQVSVTDGSDNYRSFCLMADEWMTIELPAVRNMIRTANYPIVELGNPVIHLSQPQAQLFQQRMREIADYQQSTHRFLEESLRTLYSLFLLDLMDVMDHSIGNQHQSERATELFISFMRLLPKHFLEHHDVGFYASELCITSTHLSRIVRQITGRTVMDYINQMLVMEASWLLRDTNLSVAAIAERLHFADQSSFGKFFARIKGIGPKEYRMRK